MSLSHSFSLSLSLCLYLYLPLSLPLSLVARLSPSLSLWGLSHTPLPGYRMAGRSVSDTDISAWMMSSNKMISPRDRFGLGRGPSSASSPDAIQTRPVNPAPKLKIFSAETSDHEAANVLKEEPHLTWLVPAGSTNSHVTFELEDPTQILGIEVVNDNSFQASLGTSVPRR